MIVCLGWGSLIWRPEKLPLVDSRPEAWREDGPELPLEFARVSGGGRLTLVIDPESLPVRVLWNELSVATIAEAVEALRHREGTRSSWIGRWPNGCGFQCASVIERWARQRDFEAVVWSAMPTKFNGQDGLRPTQSEAVQYLTHLEGKVSYDAKEYVRRAPIQIATPYRPAIDQALGLTDSLTHGTKKS